MSAGSTPRTAQRGDSDVEVSHSVPEYKALENGFFPTDRYLAYDLQHMLEKFLQRLEKYPCTLQEVVNSSILEFQVEMRLSDSESASRFRRLYVGKVTMPPDDPATISAWLNSRGRSPSLEQRKGMCNMLVHSEVGQCLDVGLKNTIPHWRRRRIFPCHRCEVFKMGNKNGDDGRVAWLVGRVTYYNSSLR